MGFRIFGSVWFSSVTYWPSSQRVRVTPSVSETAPKGQATAVLRPSDLTLSDPKISSEHAILGTVRQEIYLGAELHYLVDADAGGEPWRVTDKDNGAGFSKGQKVALSYDPDAIHLIEEDA